MLAATLLVLMTLAPAAPTGEVDLTKIERKIAKEPKYWGQPKYVLAVFGPKAETKVWLAFDGDELYFGGDGSDDLSAASRKAPYPLVQVATPGRGHATWADLPITEKDGKTQHKLTVVQQRPSGKLTLKVEGPRVQYTGGIDDGELMAADKAAEAPIVHFGGPLIAVVGTRHWPNTVLELAGKIEAGADLKLQAKLATPGLGKGAFASLNPALGGSLPANGSEKLGPDGIVAEIEYPAAEAGKPAVKQKVQMGMTCCCGFFTADARVPAGVGAGKARVTFTVPGSSPGLTAEKSYEFEVK